MHDSFYEFQDRHHGLSKRVLNHFVSQIFVQSQGSSLEEDEEGAEDREMRLSLSGTEWNSEVERFCTFPMKQVRQKVSAHLSVLNAFLIKTAAHRMCRDVEILGSPAVRTLTNLSATLSSAGGGQRPADPHSVPPLVGLVVDEDARGDSIDAKGNHYRLDFLGSVGDVLCPETVRCMKIQRGHLRVKTQCKFFFRRAPLIAEVHAKSND